MFTDFFHQMGWIRYPLYFAAAFMVLQILTALLQTLKPTDQRSPMVTHAILVWGALNALLGVLGTVLGLTIAGGSIERAGGVELSLLAAGFKISLYPTIFGLLMLTVAILAWLALQLFTWKRDAQAPA